MTDKELDDLFSKSFAGHEMPVPPDMWQRVNPQKEEKRRVAFWWWTGLGVAALFLLVGGIIHFSSFSAKPEQNIISASSDSEKKKTDKTQQAGTNHEQSQATTRPAHDEKELSSVSSSGGNRKEAESKRNVSPGILSFGINKRNTAITHRSGNPLLAPSGGPSVVLDKGNKTETDVPVSPVYESEKDNQQIAGNNTTITGENNIASKQKEDSAKQLLTANNATKEAKPEAAATPVHVKKIHGEKAAGIELMIAGYGNDRKVYDVEKIASQTLINFGPIEHKSKASIQSFSVNLRIDKPLTRHFSLKTGLQFMQARQRVTYNQESVSRFSLVNSLSANNDTVFSARIRSEKPVVKSVYNSVSVPLLLHYHTNGAKMNVGATAGVLFNVASWYSGKVPDAHYQQTRTADSTFKHNIGSSLYLGFTVSKQFGSYQLFAEPNVQYTLSSVTKNSAGFKQKMAAYGIGIGIRKRIGK